jgi:hypothetical protein
VKCKHLVLALRDYYMEKSHAPSGQSKQDQIAHEDGRGNDERLTQEAWALRYLTVLRVQPLLEALDDDFSSHVTIAEINGFTSSCPKEWRSVPLVISPRVLN